MLKRILIVGMATIFFVWPASLSAQQQPGRMKGRVFVLLSNPQFNDIRGTVASSPRTFQLALRVIF